jgi:hypothetical protein
VLCRLVKEGAELLAQRLIAAERGSAGSPHVQQLAIIGGDGQGGNAGMLAVKLPPLIEPYAASSPGATLLHAFLREKHNIEVCASQVHHTAKSFQELPVMLAASASEDGAGFEMSSMPSLST